MLATSLFLRKKKLCIKKLAILFLSGYACPLFAQVTISPGMLFQIQGAPLVSFNDINLVNNGTFSPGTGTVTFTGNTASAISGSQAIQFYKLVINKSFGSSVLLQRTVGVTQDISFTNGFLDLNNNNIDLGTTGSLIGEQENSRIIGANGGQVLFSTILNAPVAANPANLGAIITSSQNLGNVIIRRGHQSQSNIIGQGSSVLRYFDIIPQNNTALNATLRIKYFDGELNAIPEPTLIFWKSVDNVNWTNEGYTSKDNTLNYVEKTGIPSFSRWTLSGPGGAVIANLKLFLQGYYVGSGIMQPVLSNQGIIGALPNQTDTVTVELHHAGTFSLLESKKAILFTNGNISANFNQPAGSYYIAVKHRNTIQTWSAAPIAISTTTPLYDFSAAVTKAMGDNEVLVGPGVWAFFTGDISQDDYIDGNDFPQYDFESASGGLYDGTYTATDMNGDGFIDGNDFPVYDLNSSNGVSAIHP